MTAAILAIKRKSWKVVGRDDQPVREKLPDHVAWEIKERVRRNRWPLEGALLSILGEAARPSAVSLSQPDERLTAGSLPTAEEVVEIFMEIREKRWL